jgi:uncharacterized protein DUF5658
MRFARLPHGAAAWCVVVAAAFAFSTAAVAAQEQSTPSESIVGAGVQAVAAIQPTAVAVVPPANRRPAALVPLYASFVTLQILDLHSTNHALSRGGVETNPALAGLSGSMVAMSAVKAAGTAGVIVISEKLQKKNKAAALGLMIAANSAMAWVVQHNYRLPLP